VPVAAGGAAAVPPPLALRLARAGARIGDARVLDRLVRGRAWIAIVAAGLMGIVFMQVSMLQLNAGISRAVTSAETLHQQNAKLRAEISELDSGQRIQDAASALGMVAPPAGDVNYLDARKADGRAAARAIRQPDPLQQSAAASTTAPIATTVAPAPAPAQTQAPAAQAQTTAPAAAAAQAPAATATAPPAATQPQTQAAPATTTAPAAAAPPPTTTAPATTAPVAPAATAVPQGN
jgi:cell division protein FtsL